VCTCVCSGVTLLVCMYVRMYEQHDRLVPVIIVCVAATAATYSDVLRNVLVICTRVNDANASIIKLLHSSFWISLLITH